MRFDGTLREGGREHVLSLALRDGVLRGTDGGRPVPEWTVERRGAAILLRRAGAAVRAVVARDGDRLLVHLGGRVHEIALPGSDGPRRERGGRGAQDGDGTRVVSPMTGTLAELPVKPGDAVSRGGTLAIVEAMKMQFVVRAPRDLVVRAVAAEPGKPVEIGQTLVEFEPDAATEGAPA